MSNDQFAHSAALTIADAPGEAYNPLLLFGGTGLGKTHLLQAIGAHVATRQPEMRVRCVTMERFMQEFTLAGQGSALARFRRQYRVRDLLLVDDVQPFAGKKRLQREFLELFDTLHAGRRQVVLASDRPAEEIPGLDPAFFARFEWGLVTDLQPPDFETRLAILHRRAAEVGVGLPDELAQFLAKHVSVNIRRLGGAMSRVVSYASISGDAPSVPMANALLGEVLRDEIAFVDVRRPNQSSNGSSFGLN
ncbi:MAG: ATP-binding protein [Verrucomicrobia bacterium]|nr:ATP-binding protein [Verrucomicrobiota bacterium]